MVDPGLLDPKLLRGGSQDSGLDLWDQVVKIGEWWLDQKLSLLEAGLPNESNILQDGVIVHSKLDNASKFELPST
jgi:hypothetical protein